MASIYDRAAGIYDTIFNAPERAALGLGNAIAPYDITTQIIQGDLDRARAAEEEAIRQGYYPNLADYLYGRLNPPTPGQVQSGGFIGPPPAPGFIPQDPTADALAGALGGLGLGAPDLRVTSQGIPLPQAPVLQAPPAFDPTPLIAAYEQGRPQAPQGYTQNDRLLAVLQGLAQGAGGRSVAEVLGGAGAGGLGNLLEIQAAEHNQQQQYQDALSQFERQQAIFEHQLARDKQETEIAATNIRNENAINSYNRGVQAFQAAKPQFQISGPYLISSITDPDTGQTVLNRTVIDDAAYAVQQLQLMQALGAPTAEVQILLGDKLEKLQVPAELRPLYQTAAQVLLAPTNPQFQVLLANALGAADVALAAELSPSGDPQDGLNALTTLKRSDNASYRQRQSLFAFRYIVSELSKKPELVARDFNGLVFGGQRPTAP